jgi:hypothetical protein
MYDIAYAIDHMEEALAKVEAAIDADPLVDTAFISRMSKVSDRVSALRDRVFNSYKSSGIWAQDHYLTGTSALVHETGLLFRDVKKSVIRGKLINSYRDVSDAVEAGEITHDHLDYLIPCYDEKYRAFFDRDVSLLLDNAKKLSSQHFGYVVRHWKNIVNDEIHEPSDEYKRHAHRRLFLSETLYGTWDIQGELDAVTGTILNKALSDITEKLWRNRDENIPTSHPSHATLRADAMGYLAQGYVSNSFAASSPDSSDCKHDQQFSFTAPVSSDIVIEADMLTASKSTQEFLRDSLTRTTPMSKTHSNTFYKQLLCDTTLSVPVTDGAITNFGRRVRTAPAKLKRHLALRNSTCSIDGCATPASWCDAHHIHHWIDGGETKIENLMLLCRRHHTMIHNDKTFQEKATASFADTG